MEISIQPWLKLPTIVTVNNGENWQSNTNMKLHDDITTTTGNKRAKQKLDSIISDHTSMCMAFPIFQNSMQQPTPELASIIHEVSLSSKYRKTINWQKKFTITDFADSPSMDLFLFQNWISARKIKYTLNPIYSTLPVITLEG